MGNLFAGGGPERLDVLSKSQSRLLPQLGEFLSGQLGTEIPGISELQSTVLGGLGGGQELAREIFKGGFLDPALNTFDEEIGPRIDTGFAGIGGSLSSRRGVARERALTNITTQAQGQFTRMLPEILGFPAQNALTSAQALGGLEALKFIPAQQALGFINAGTGVGANRAPGVGFNILGDLLGAGATAGTAGLFGAFDEN